jgi:hypothetical protein
LYEENDIYFYDVRDKQLVARNKDCLPAAGRAGKSVSFFENCPRTLFVSGCNFLRRSPLDRISRFLGCRLSGMPKNGTRRFLAGLS